MGILMVIYEEFFFHPFAVSNPDVSTSFNNSNQCLSTPSLNCLINVELSCLGLYPLSICCTEIIVTYGRRIQPSFLSLWGLWAADLEERRSSHSAPGWNLISSSAPGIKQGGQRGIRTSTSGGNPDLIRNVGGKMKTQAGQSGSHKKIIRANWDSVPADYFFRMRSVLHTVSKRG